MDEPMPRRALASPACLLSDSTVTDAGRPLRLRVRRIYEAPQRGDGLRVLVDRLWPRGISKERAHLGAWAKEIAPSTELRQWFGHQPRKWSEFGRRYRRELKAHAADLDALRAQARRRTVTLLYAAKDPQHNHALVLKAVLEGDAALTR